MLNTISMVWFFALTTLTFALVAAYFSARYERKIKEVERQQKDIQRNIYERTLLQEIAEKIGYSLNIEAIAETIALTVQNLFDISTVSYAIKSSGNVINIKTFKKESLPVSYTENVSKIILGAMAAIDNSLSTFTFHQNVTSISQSNLDTYFDAVPLSYFNIPLVVGNKFVGMVNISSRKKGVYQDADMSLLYKIINTAQQAISKLENIIETEKAKLDGLISGLPSGTIMFTVQKGHFELSVLNEAARNFLKLEQDPDIAEVLRHFSRDLEIAQNIKKVFETKKPIEINKAKIFDRFCRIYMNPVFLPSEQTLIGVAIVLRDLTLEIKLEQVRSDFTNMTVHELRAPLTAIKGASALLFSPTINDQDREKMIHVISEAARDMLNSVSQLLDFSRLEAGKFNINKDKSSIIKLISDHVDVFSYAARQKNIQINFNKYTEIPEFFFDAGRVGQVINNLVSNSLKFTNEGGKIDINVAQKDGQISVEIADNGIGIPESRKPLLFTKFGQIDPVLEKRLAAEGSSGLGLYISREIVEAHGGKIWLESKEGEGTKVFFTLPFLIEEKKDYSAPSEFAN